MLEKSKIKSFHPYFLLLLLFFSDSFLPFQTCRSQMEGDLSSSSSSSAQWLLFEMNQLDDPDPLELVRKFLHFTFVPFSHFSSIKGNEIPLNGSAVLIGIAVRK